MEVSGVTVPIDKTIVSRSLVLMNLLLIKEFFQRVLEGSNGEVITTLILYVELSVKLLSGFFDLLFQRPNIISCPNTNPSASREETSL